jgi:hypothetical protein
MGVASEFAHLHGLFADRLVVHLQQLGFIEDELLS